MYTILKNITIAVVRKGKQGKCRRKAAKKNEARIREKKADRKNHCFCGRDALGPKAT